VALRKRSQTGNRSKKGGKAWHILYPPGLVTHLEGEWYGGEMVM